MNGFPYVHGTGIRGFFTANHAEQGRLPCAITAYDATMAPLGTENESSEMSNRSSNALDTPSTSSTLSPSRGLAEYRFLGFRFGLELLSNSTHQSARGALGFAWRAFGWVRTHSNSALIAF